MATVQQKSSSPNTLRQLGTFFHRLQWKLTLSYALFTATTALVLGIVGLALVWYFAFWSNAIPNRVAGDLLRVTPLVSPYLESTPTDQAGLDNWLHDALIGNDLVVNVPGDNNEGDRPLPPPRLDRVVTIAVVNAADKVIASYPADSFSPGQSLPVPPEATIAFKAALRGQTDPTELATRDEAGNIIAAAPVFDSNKRLVGAIFIQTAPPFKESEFLQFVLRQTILPVVLGILVVGGVAGVFFGYFIARDLTRRLYAVAGAADAWSQGDFDVLVHDNSGDELGQLAHRLNQMALQLQTLMQTRQELATLEERNRLARDLHDSVKQQFFAAAMQIGAAQALLPQQPDAAQNRLTEAERLAHQAQQELTTLIRELRPAALEGKGLAAALRDHLSDWSRQNQINADIRVQGERPLPLVIEQALFRVAQEAMANISRHSGATIAEVHLACTAHQITLAISDNGQGFQVGATNGKGLGLRSMRERIESLGGHLDIESELRRGTRIVARVTIA